MKINQLLTSEWLTRNELIAMEAVLKELRTIARRQEVHLSLNRGAVKNGLNEVRQNLLDFREFLLTRSESTSNEEAETTKVPSEVSLADLADKIDYIRQELALLNDFSDTTRNTDSQPDVNKFKGSYHDVLKQIAGIPNDLDERIQMVLGNAQRQVYRYCIKFLAIHQQKPDSVFLMAYPFIAAFCGGFLGAIVVLYILF